jgi:hypothetical protein
MDYTEILKYILPSLIVFFTAFFILKQFTDTEKKRAELNLLMKNKDIVTPLRLQAYERMVLLLERISPESLIVRVNKPGMTSQELQNEMLRSIRAEFEHNLSQQIYVSVKAWEVIKKSRAELIQLINSSATKIGSKEPSLKLSQIILETVIESKKSPTGNAIDLIKKEVSLLF